MLSIFSAGFIICATISGMLVEAVASRAPWCIRLSVREFSAVISAREPSDSASRRARSASARARVASRFGLGAARSARRPRCRRWRRPPRLPPARASPPSRASGRPPRARARSARAPARGRSRCAPARPAACACASSACLAASWIELSTLRISELSCASISSLRSSRCLSISRERVSCSRSMRAFSDATIACSRARAVSASLAALIFSISRRWPICACSSSWPSSRRRLVASSWVWRTEMSASASISVRFFLLHGDDLGELAHPDRVEGVVLVERRERRLVQPGQRHRIEQHAVLRQVVAQQLGDLATNSARFSCSVSIVSLAATDCSASTKRPSSRLRMPSGVKALRADRLRGGGDALDRGLHAHVELELDVDAHAVVGDQRLFAGAPHLHADGAHVDLVDLVQERQRQAAARDHDALAAEAGADERDVARRLAVEAVEKDDHDRDHDDRDDDAEKPGEHHHVVFPFRIWRDDEALQRRAPRLTDHWKTK